MTEPGLLTDEMVIAKWGEIAEAVEVLTTRIQTPNEFQVEPNSEFAADDSASSPYQISHAAKWCLNAGVDHMHALKSLVVDARRLHAYGSYGLVRGALENFAAGFWILHPNDPVQDAGKQAAHHRLGANESGADRPRPVRCACPVPARASADTDPQSSNRICRPPNRLAARCHLAFAARCAFDVRKLVGALGKSLLISWTSRAAACSNNRSSALSFSFVFVSGASEYRPKSSDFGPKSTKSAPKRLRSWALQCSFTP